MLDNYLLKYKIIISINQIEKLDSKECYTVSKASKDTVY